MTIHKYIGWIIIAILLIGVVLPLATSVIKFAVFVAGAIAAVWIVERALKEGKAQ